MNKEFLSVFQLSKTEVLFVDYYTLSNNPCADFTLSGAVFCRSKLDYTMCGQCQEDVTKKHITARNFVKKWNAHHLHDLNPAEYDDMLSDLEKLKETYNFILMELDGYKKPYNPRISFYEIQRLSKETLKINKKKGDN